VKEERLAAAFDRWERITAVPTGAFRALDDGIVE
jgi:hypothetical protein